MEYKAKLLTLYFTVPLVTPVPYEKIKDFSLAVYDPEMYVSLTFNQKTRSESCLPNPLLAPPTPVTVPLTSGTTSIFRAILASKLPIASPSRANLNRLYWRACEPRLRCGSTE